MKEIRTPKGKLYGTLDVRTYVLHIKDGGNVRLIQVPPESGLKLQYISKNDPPEDVCIPSMDKLLAAV
jgi:hypothetical protein